MTVKNTPLPISGDELDQEVQQQLKKIEQEDVPERLLDLARQLQAKLRSRNG
ncbi:hypothetical protein [Oceaniglobus roseus]|uniref:hypothetical protein n=1 Tax=Oceaniglobus roseus TaxID=1737570 RepID=UPI0013000E9D|nr:hypothetical protein [Kandeliimicrobium roseum]